VRTPLREFLAYLKTGKSPIALLLDNALADPAAYRDHPHLPAFREPHHCDDVCPDCKEWLGLSEDQVTHINGWPDGQIERIRQVIVRMIDGGKPGAFFWGVTGKDVEQVGVVEGSGHVTVRMESPEWVLRLDGEHAEMEVTETEPQEATR